MTEKRNFFNRIFGKNDNDNNYYLMSNQGFAPVQMLTAYTNKTNTFYNGELYNDDTVRSCIDAIARHFSKMQMVHKLKNVEQKDNLNKLLKLRPNEDMSSYDFLYKTLTALYLHNNAYVYVQRNELGEVKALYPILYSEAELMEDSAGNHYLKFRFKNGKTITENIQNLIVLRKHFYKDFFGESNQTTLNPILSLLKAIRDGIINISSSSAIIRGILNLTGNLQEDDRKSALNRFKTNYLNASNNGGVVVTDSKMEFTPVNTEQTLIDDKNNSLAVNRVFNYFGVSENIIKGTYTDDEFQAFFEGVLEPLAVQFTQEFTAKIFTQREIEFGNEIVFVADKLSYLSIESKCRMFEQIKELGVISKGEIAEIFNLQQPPDADEYLQSLNYIDSKIANEYQLKGAKNTTTTTTE